MKECPSCQSSVQSPLLLCPNCGYSFDSEPEPSEAREVKKTMMGIPSIELSPSGSSSEDSGDGDGRKTMFGFPVNEFISEALDEGTNAYEESATQIVDADQFMLDESLNNDAASDAPRFVDKPSPMRSTMAGGMPSLSQLHQAHQDLSEFSEDEEEDEGARTMVAAASLFQFDGAADEVQPPEPADSPKLHERPKKHETLMGMSLEDLAPDDVAKRTLFSIPTHDDIGEGLSEFSEDESDAEEDIPTQAISGAVFAQEPVQDATREQNRQRLLDKLRAHNQTSDEERPTRSTMFGIPAVSQDASSAPTPEDSPRLTPHTGVLKVAKKGASRLEPNSEAVESSSSSVLGNSSYMLNKDSSVIEEPEVVQSPRTETKKPLPSLSLSRALKDKLSAAQAKPAEPPAASLKPSVKVPEEDKTQVVSDSVLEAALATPLSEEPPRLFEVAESSGLAQESAPTVQGDSLQVEDDMTREQSIADLNLQLRQSSEQPATPRKHFSEDATRQHDLASIREQLGDDLFALEPSESSDAVDHDATAVAPSLEDATAIAPPIEGISTPPTSNTGPLFATGRPSTPQPEEIPELSMEPVEPLPELDVLPVEPLPEVPVAPARPVAPVTPEPAPVVDLPMIDAEPVPLEPAYKTVTTTSTPTPPHGTQIPGQGVAAQQPTNDGQGGVGRVFQIIFGVLGALCFICATVLPLAGVATPPDQELSAVVYGASVVGVLTLLGALLPMNKVRQGLLIVATLLGIGLFAAGLLLGMPVVMSILALVGALFALTAILFPVFASSM